MVTTKVLAARVRDPARMAELLGWGWPEFISGGRLAGEYLPPEQALGLSRLVAAVNPLIDAGRTRMLKLVQWVSVTEAKQTFALLVEAVEQSNEPVVITRRGDAAVVLMSFEAFEELNSSSSDTRSNADR